MLTDLLRSFVFMLCEMAPYLLLGFLVAGVLHEFVPEDVFRRFIGKENFRSVLWATLIGIPLPLCSCGVIPTGVSLRKNGASRGATVAFMVATPQVGVDSIIATYSLMGLPFAICRPLVALCTALAGGAVTAHFGKDEIEVQVKPTCSKVRKPFGQRLLDMLRYAFIEMIQNIGKWLVIGLAIGALITVFIPDQFFASLHLPSIVTMLIVLLVAVPMYTCSMGSIPIAAALVAKGLSAGTALVLLVAGPAASIASFMVIGKALGRRQLGFYSGTIILGSLLGGLIIDTLPIDFAAHVSPHLIHGCHGGNAAPTLFQILCTALFTLFFIIAFTMKLFHKESTLQEGQALYHVDGMHCTHCQASVEKAVSAVEGVEKVEVNLKKGTLIVTGNATPAAIEQAVTNAGFTFGK